ncbi:MAG TPA: TetR/AcrR family transcriptional regulator, partial [Candidatus Kurthia intestinigallinarum]|nr:TetR/AcrR family transcriptional regulator [Candidatus Kurthia intestinigallinarum]
MSAQTTDPRAIRTRQLIVDAFNQLIKTKDFDQISVKNITELATINRATFYAHFVDKYDLLDVVLTDETGAVMKTYFTCQEVLSKDLLVRMFISIVDI